jgi:hypothetical protein
MDWVITFVALASAIALTWGARHWAWWVVAALSGALLAVQIVRKLAHLRKAAQADDLAAGRPTRREQAPSGRRLS